MPGGMDTIRGTPRSTGPGRTMGGDTMEPTIHTMVGATMEAITHTTHTTEAILRITQLHTLERAHLARREEAVARGVARRRTVGGQYRVFLQESGLRLALADGGQRPGFPRLAARREQVVYHRGLAVRLRGGKLIAATFVKDGAPASRGHVWTLRRHQVSHAVANA